MAARERALSSWSALAEELDAWREAGRTPELWWRDDDASAPTPALARLLDASRRCGVIVAIAAIGEQAEPALLEQAACVILHGCDHRNRAASGEKKTEFPAGESDEAALERLRRTRRRFASLAGERFVPVLAPPWNRLREALVPRLREAGLRGLSRYGARRAARGGGPIEVNTHVDLIAWRRDRRFVGEAEALALLVDHLRARREGTADPREPTGILTHHALHDGESWAFLERLFDETRRGSAAWLDPAQIFSGRA